MSPDESGFGEGSALSDEKRIGDKALPQSGSEDDTRDEVSATHATKTIKVAENLNGSSQLLTP